MSNPANPWPTPQNDVPAGFVANAVQLVRDATGWKSFALVQRLGITATELTECVNAGRWPRSENARRKLIELARENQVDIGGAEETSLF